MSADSPYRPDDLPLLVEAVEALHEDRVLDRISAESSDFLHIDIQYRLKREEKVDELLSRLRAAMEEDDG